MVAVIALAVLVGAIVLGAVALVVTRYKRCLPDRAPVVFGRTADPSGFEVHTVGGTLVLPVVQGYGWLDLTPLSLRVAPPRVFSADGLAVDVGIDMAVAIDRDPQVVRAAAQRLFRKSKEEVGEIAGTIAAGVLSEVVLQHPSTALMATTANAELLSEFVDAYEQEVTRIGLEVRRAEVIELLVHEA